LEHDERVTIHVMHRLGAIVTTVYLTWLILMVYLKAQTSTFKSSAIVVGVALSAQVALGIGNI